MRFALLCDDPNLELIVKFFSDRLGDHRLVYVVGHLPFSFATTGAAAGIKSVGHWEDLLTVKDLDAVIVGGGSALILEGAKQFATAGIPLLFLPRSDQGSTFIYELSLIRDDNRVPLIPLLSHRFDTAATNLKNDIGAGKLGRIQFLQVTRTVSRPSANTPIPLTEIDTQLLFDVDVLRWLMGDYDQVTCLRTGAKADGILMQNVVLAGRALPEANWSLSPSVESEQWLLTVRGERGTAKLQRDGAGKSFSYECEDHRSQGNELETAQRTIDAFANLVGNPPIDQVRSTTIDRQWADLVKCFETVDATHRSIKRKRTIELHFEPMSERAIFKTQMTAIGCGLLIATLLLMLLYLGVASFVEPTINPRTITSSDTDARAEQAGQDGFPDRKPSLPFAHRILLVLRLLVFAPLVLFLAAQILLPLTRPSSNERPSERTRNGTS